MMSSLLKITGIIVCALSILSGCSVESEQMGKAIEDQVGNVTDKNNEYVLAVKNGHPLDMPDRLFGDTFEEFFGSPTWTYFKAETGENVVEFTGYMMYEEVKVKARLQFIVEEETLEVGALSFNEVPQNELIKSAVLNKVFEVSSSEQSTAPTKTTPSNSSEFTSKSEKEDFIEAENSADNNELEFLSGDYYYSDPNNPLNEVSVSIIDRQINGTIVINTMQDKTAFIEFNGTLESGVVKAEFEDDGWGESGTINLKLDDSTAVLDITNDQNKNSSGWGVSTGTYEFVRLDYQ